MRKTARRLSTRIALLALVFGLAGAAVAEETAKAPGELKFEAQNKGYQARGEFKKWRVTEVSIPDGDITQGSAKLEIDLASVAEKSAELAAHLRTADFFDVEKFTRATVEIKNVEHVKDMDYKATATVNLHGVTKDVPVEFSVVSGDGKPLKITGKALLKREDFTVGQPYDAENPRSIENNVMISLTATLVADSTSGEEAEAAEEEAADSGEETEATDEEAGSN